MRTRLLAATALVLLLPAAVFVAGCARERYREPEPARATEPMILPWPSPEPEKSK